MARRAPARRHGVLPPGALAARRRPVPAPDAPRGPSPHRRGPRPGIGRRSRGAGVVKEFARALTIPAPRRTSRRSCEAAVSLGVLLDGPRSAAPRVDPGLLRDILTAPAGTITLLSGPSGAGKSTLLRAARRALRAERRPVIDATAARTTVPERPLVDLFPGTVDDALRALARAGLSEAGVVLRTPAALSVGQRIRLDLALALARAERATPRPGEVTLLIDEFGASLDRATAAGVGAMLRRFVSERAGLRAIVASCREEAPAWLTAEREVSMDLAGAAIYSPCRWEGAGGGTPGATELRSLPTGARDPCAGALGVPLPGPPPGGEGARCSPSPWEGAGGGTPGATELRSLPTGARDACAGALGVPLPGPPPGGEGARCSPSPWEGVGRSETACGAARNGVPGYDPGSCPVEVEDRRGARLRR
ncbi:MAG TPA: hypothetical protein DEB06_00520, partial [Phycisphaerales bacterium]|nr:hypothetical protein [Phycisphaerales bacterium]